MMCSAGLDSSNRKTDSIILQNAVLSLRKGSHDHLHGIPTIVTPDAESGMSAAITAGSLEVTPTASASSANLNFAKGRFLCGILTTPILNRSGMAGTNLRTLTIPGG